MPVTKTPVRRSAVEKIRKHHFSKPATFPITLKVHVSKLGHDKVLESARPDAQAVDVSKPDGLRETDMGAYSSVRLLCPMEMNMAFVLQAWEDSADAEKLDQWQRWGF